MPVHILNNILYLSFKKGSHCGRLVSEFRFSLFINEANLVCHIKGGTWTGGVQEQSSKENIWTKEG
jgi:hypothetical protein